MKKYLIKLADHLDKKGLHKEANYVDWIIKKSNYDISKMDIVDFVKDQDDLLPPSVAAYKIKI